MLAFSSLTAVTILAAADPAIVLDVRQPGPDGSVLKTKLDDLDGRLHVRVLGGGKVEAFGSVSVKGRGMVILPAPWALVVEAGTRRHALPVPKKRPPPPSIDFDVAGATELRLLVVNRDAPAAEPPARVVGVLPLPPERKLTSPSPQQVVGEHGPLWVQTTGPAREVNFSLWAEASCLTKRAVGWAGTTDGFSAPLAPWRPRNAMSPCPAVAKLVVDEGGHEGRRFLGTVKTALEAPIRISRPLAKARLATALVVGERTHRAVDVFALAVDAITTRLGDGTGLVSVQVSEVTQGPFANYGSLTPPHRLELRQAKERTPLEWKGDHYEARIAADAPDRAELFVVAGPSVRLGVVERPTPLILVEPAPSSDRLVSAPIPFATAAGPVFVKWWATSARGQGCKNLSQGGSGTQITGGELKIARGRRSCRARIKVTREEYVRQDGEGSPSFTSRKRSETALSVLVNARSGTRN